MWRVARPKVLRLSVQHSMGWRVGMTTEDLAITINLS
jgi:hypothetical protein